MPARTVSPAEVARVLQLVASRPNLRRRRRPGDIDGPFDEWFDGGAVRPITGGTVFQFGDGTRAEVADAPALLITIVFRDGARVVVEQR